VAWLLALAKWLCLALAGGLALARLARRRLGLVINPLGLGYGRLATGCAWLGATWA